MQPDAYSQDAYADIFARQQGDIPAGMEFVEPRNVDDLLSPCQITNDPCPQAQWDKKQLTLCINPEYGKMLAQQSQARRDEEVASPLLVAAKILFRLSAE